MWLREYVFNSLLPVIHILIYTIFVTSAEELVDKNPLYAVVCIGFILPAEKFIRKMFGFEKASTVSQVGAAAGGAMVMNAINKISQSGGNGGKGGNDGKSGKGKAGTTDRSPKRIAEKPDGGQPLTNPPDNSNPMFTGGNDGMGGTTAGATKKPRRTIKRSRKRTIKFRKTIF